MMIKDRKLGVYSTDLTHTTYHIIRTNLLDSSLYIYFLLQYYKYFVEREKREITRAGMGNVLSVEFIYVIP